MQAGSKQTERKLTRTFQISSERNLSERWQVEAAVKLIDEGNTIPFYFLDTEREATGSLNDEVLRNLYERLELSARNLEEKKDLRYGVLIGRAGANGRKK